MSGQIMFQKTRGFTLIELMTTIAILAVIAALAIPSFNTIIKNNRLTAAANEVVSAIASARGEAIKRKTNVTMGPKGSGWADGIIVKDATGDLFEGDSFPQGISASGDNSVITFNANGYTSSASPLGDDGLTICSSDINNGRLVKLHRSGSVTVTRTDC